jgi:predicted acylesterase/phospholipase RssA
LRKAVVLSGGAARGALQISAIELNNDADVWIGTSVGAVNGCAAASSRTSILRSMWHRVNGIGDFTNLNIDMWRGIFTLKPLKKLMEENRALSPRLPFYVGMFDYALARHELVCVSDFADDSAKVWSAVQASASQPFQHEAVQFNGRWMGDGGIVATLPPLPANEQFDEVHAVFCTPTKMPLRPVEPGKFASAIEQAVRSIEYMISQSTYASFRRLCAWRDANPGTRVFVYEPEDWDVVGSPFDASRATIAARLDYGDVMVKNRRELSGT